MMDFYCTLFCSNYLMRFLAMYNSMCRTGDNFHLFLFPMDYSCERILNKLSLEFTTMIPIDKFENDVLKEKKQERTVAEYCWTCTASSIDYIFENYKISELTYLDADLFFFQKPSVILDEFHESIKDVLLIEHRYSSNTKNQKALYGKYNVQFMTFKNTTKARRALRWWKESCIEWCYAVSENGKFADQKYLDDFPKKFDCVYELRNIGGGVAPWNVHNYCISRDKDNNPTVNGEKIVFYHFHNLKVLMHAFNPGTQYGSFSDVEINTIYEPYLKTWKENETIIRKIEKDFHYYTDEWDGTDFEGIVLQESLQKKLHDTFRSILGNNKEYSIWGYGDRGKKLVDLFKRYDIQIGMIVDSKDMSGEKEIVYNPQSLRSSNSMVIITPIKGIDEIESKLGSWGYIRNVNYIRVDELYAKLYNTLFRL